MVKYLTLIIICLPVLYAGNAQLPAQAVSPPNGLATDEFSKSMTTVANPDTVFYKFDRMAYIHEFDDRIQLKINVANYHKTIVKIMEEVPSLTVICRYLNDKQCTEELFVLHQCLSLLTNQQLLLHTLDNNEKNKKDKRETYNSTFTQELIFLFDQTYRESRANLQILEQRILKLEHNIRIFRDKSRLNDLLYAISYLEKIVRECFKTGQVIHDVLTGRKREIVNIIPEATLLKLF